MVSANALTYVCDSTAHTRSQCRQERHCNHHAAFAFFAGGVTLGAQGLRGVATALTLPHPLLRKKLNLKVHLKYMRNTYTAPVWFIVLCDYVTVMVMLPTCSCLKMPIRLAFSRAHHDTVTRRTTATPHAPLL